MLKINVNKFAMSRAIQSTQLENLNPRNFLFVIYRQINALDGCKLNSKLCSRLRLER